MDNIHDDIVLSVVLQNYIVMETICKLLDVIDLSLFNGLTLIEIHIRQTGIVI